MSTVDFSNRNIKVLIKETESPFVTDSKFINARPILVVSSTSWTQDEDFSVLFSALAHYDEYKDDLPVLYMVITGKGPMKQYYEQEFEKLDLKRVKLYFAWLDFQDYAKLLACADFGISLHTSSSGLDLPMKIVDMMGAGIPVFAFDFNCISEIIRHRENGFIFQSDKILAELIVEFVNTPDRESLFHAEVAKFQKRGWNQAWDEILLPNMY